MPDAGYSESYPPEVPFQGSFEADRIIETMRELRLRRSQYIVIGGATLVLRGIKQYTPDIDMLVSPGLFESLGSREGVDHRPAPRSAILRGATNTTVWFRSTRHRMPVSATTSMGGGYYPMSYGDHKENAEVVRGINCLPLADVRAAKEALQRENDVRDLAHIARYLGETLELPPPMLHPPFEPS